MHISDLHFGWPAVAERLDSLRREILDLKPDAVVVSGDLTQRCTDSEFARAREFLDSIRRVARTVVVPGNHDVRWLAAGPGTSIRTHNFKYSRYFRHISKELNPSLELPGAVIAGLNTAHGPSKESLTHRLRDLGVIGYAKKEDLGKVEEAFERAAPDAARVVVAHHNPVKGPISGRHGLANAGEALGAFGKLGVELVLCGHDHQQSAHHVKTMAPGFVISIAGTISDRPRGGRPPSFNLVELDGTTIDITTYTWGRSANFSPSSEHSFPRCSVSSSNWGKKVPPAKREPGQARG